MIKSATYPVIPAALGIFFWVLLDSFNSQGTRKPHGDDPKSIKFIFWIMVICILLLVLANVISLATHLYYLFVSEPEKRLSYALPVASILSIIYFLSKPPILMEKNRLVRNFVIIFICALPSASYFQGSENITSILNEKSNFYYLKTSSKNCPIEGGSKFIYLGFYSGNYFFVNSVSKDICIEKDSSVLLSFSQHKEVSDTKEPDLSPKESQPANQVDL